MSLLKSIRNENFFLSFLYIFSCTLCKIISYWQVNQNQKIAHKSVDSAYSVYKRPCRSSMSCLPSFGFSDISNLLYLAYCQGGWSLAHDGLFHFICSSVDWVLLISIFIDSFKYESILLKKYVKSKIRLKSITALFFD